MSKKRVSISSLREEIERLQAEVLQLRDVLQTGDKVIFVPLPGTGLEAQIRLKRGGQQLPNEGDEVRVEAKICLPSVPCVGYSAEILAPQIRMGRRVMLHNCSLSDIWGNAIKDEHFRFLCLSFHAPTWKEAFRKAEEWGRSEIVKLVSALTAREKALRDAEVV